MKRKASLFEISYVLGFLAHGWGVFLVGKHFRCCVTTLECFVRRTFVLRFLMWSCDWMRTWWMWNSDRFILQHPIWPHAVFWMTVFFCRHFLFPCCCVLKRESNTLLNFLCFFRFEDVGAGGSNPLCLWAAAGRQAQRRTKTDLQYPRVTRPTGQTWSQWASWSTGECGYSRKRWQRWQERGKGRKRRHRYYENHNYTQQWLKRVTLSVLKDKTWSYLTAGTTERSSCDSS